ncbi:MAG: universal stress protein [Chloroflexaceae bacterium]
MKTVLVPLDGSAIARHSLPYVQMLATLLSARIHLLRVISDVDRDHMLSSDSLLLYDMGHAREMAHERTQRVWAMLQEHAVTYLEAQAQPLRHAGFDVTTEVRIGMPSEQIVRVAARESVTLMVMATHGYSGLRRWALGSVTDKVVQTTQTPVFVVRGTETELTEPVYLKRLMVPLDGSELSRQALPCALELATCAHAELLLLRAMGPRLQEFYEVAGMSGQAVPLYNEVQWAEQRRQVTRDLDATAGKLRHYDLSIATHVMDGYPAEVIVDESARHNVDAIVMATHGYGGLQRWALGSVADKVLHATSTPLILVRAHAGEH